MRTNEISTQEDISEMKKYKIKKDTTLVQARGGNRVNKHHGFEFQSRDKTNPVHARKITELT